MDFIETMADYLDGNSWDAYSVEQEKKLNRIEEKYPGFRGRYGVYLMNVDGYRSTGDDDLLIELLHEGFIIEGIFEEDVHEQMLETWKRANEVKKKFMPEDIGLTRKENEC